MIFAPNYTMAPNCIFEEWLPKLKLVELRVLMVIVRKTFGWHKIRDRISLSQLENLTGSQPSDIIKAVNSLQKLGLIEKTTCGKNGEQKTYYELVIHQCSNNSYPCESHSGGDHCESHTPTTVNLTVTKETLLKKEEEEKKVEAIAPTISAPLSTKSSKEKKPKPPKQA